MSVFMTTFKPFLINMRKAITNKAKNTDFFAM